jgi:capsular exopolysaccharide synthesis family protein
VQSASVENLSAVCYGAIPPNPSELLASNVMRDFIHEMESNYDYIIFDCPPIGVVIDSVPIVKEADGVVLVVKHNSTTYPQHYKTVDILRRSGAKILGIIMNNVDPVGTKKYGKGYGKGYGNSYSYGYYGY